MNDLPHHRDFFLISRYAGTGWLTIEHLTVSKYGKKYNKSDNVKNPTNDNHLLRNYECLNSDVYNMSQIDHKLYLDKYLEGSVQ